jgi:mRNA-degrading endonuclease RelE of RelBE toxin-antitoxin system
MPDKITKALNKLSPQEKAKVKQILEQIKSGELAGMDVKRLKGHNDIFRIRKSDIRVIYRSSGSKFSILAIERRSEKTYRDF